MAYCIFCGEPLNEKGVCSTDHSASFKKMCVNCSYCSNEGEEYKCMNEVNLKDTQEKILEAAKAINSAYDIDIKLTPIALKKPTARCKQWQLSSSAMEQVVGLFK